MSTRIRFRRGTSSQHSVFTGALGEITVNTTTNAAVVHDGTTQGGFELCRADLDNLDSTALEDVLTTVVIPGAQVDALDGGTYS